MVEEGNVNGGGDWGVWYLINVLWEWVVDGVRDMGVFVVVKGFINGIFCLEGRVSGKSFCSGFLDVVLNEFWIFV